MSYFLALGLIVVGLLVLVFALVKVLGAARRFEAARRRASLSAADVAGLLRARTAALGVAVQQRRRAAAPRG